jgi:hypothetical protein
MVAKKIAISNPRSKEDCSDNLIPFEDMLRENKVHSVKKTFEAILKALLDIRVRLPPIFYIDPKLILFDTETFDVKIIVSHEMFERKPKRPTEFTLDKLRYISPEELTNERRELTTPLWVIGCMMYEAHFKKSAFQTSLNSKVTLELIKSYPAIYPRSMMSKFRPELNDCI